MKMFPTLRRASILVSGLVALALPAHADSPATSGAGATFAPVAHSSQGTTHTITITYNAGASPQWSYSISPANDAKKARVKKRDTIVWASHSGDWTVYFKGKTPLENAAGDPLTEIRGANGGAAAGGGVAQKVKKGDVFTYGVSLLPPGANSPVVDDPEIIIEE